MWGTMIVTYLLRLELKTGRNFEAVQSYLGLFLKIHGETVAEEEVIVLLSLTSIANAFIILYHRC